MSKEIIRKMSAFALIFFFAFLVYIIDNRILWHYTKSYLVYDLQNRDVKIDMRKNVVWNIAAVLVFLLMLLGEILAVAAVVSLDMLPNAYLIILIGIFVLLSLTVGLLLFWKGRKTGKIRKLLACVLAAVILCGCAVITTVASDVVRTLQATRQEAEETAVRAVYVLADDPAQSLEDTAGYTYGYLKNYEESCTQQVLQEVSSCVGGQVSTAGYNNAFSMARALLENRIDAVILNGGYISILEDSEEFENFSGYVKVLALIEIDETQELAEEATEPSSEEAPTETTEPATSEPTQPAIGTVDYGALEPFVVYVSGSDSYDSEIVMNSRSDVNILAVVNPLTKQILLLNTPRDYYVANTSGNGAQDKLTHCGIYGTGCSMKTLGNLYDVEISYFVRINFTGFKKLIDAMGGITVYSDYAFTAITRTPIAEGENHLTGQEALDFARERYTLPDGDNERGRHQMQVITAVIEKATSGTTIIANYSQIMASVEGMFSMNIPAEMISNLVKLQLTDMARWNVVSYAATGTPSNEECYSAPGMELSVILPSQSSVSRASRLIDMVFAGEMLTEEVVNSVT